MRDVLPDPVFRRLAAHLEGGGLDAETGYESTEEDEDSVTGDMMRALRRSPRTVRVDGELWTWSVRTRKFRGRGPLATEKLIGADGIIQVELLSARGDIIRKGLLFQAKNRGRADDLREQVVKMAEAAPRGAALFDYSEHGYFATPVLGVQGVGEQLRLGQFLASRFLVCEIGRRDLWFSWEERALHLPADTKLPFLVRLLPRFVLGIQVIRP